jgi:hypothetical protein
MAMQISFGLVHSTWLNDRQRISLACSILSPIPGLLNWWPILTLGHDFPSVVYLFSISAIVLLLWSARMFSTWQSQHKQLEMPSRLPCEFYLCGYALVWYTGTHVAMSYVSLMLVRSCHALRDAGCAAVLAMDPHAQRLPSEWSHCTSESRTVCYAMGCSIIGGFSGYEPIQYAFYDNTYKQCHAHDPIRFHMDPFIHTFFLCAAWSVMWIFLAVKSVVLLYTEWHTCINDMVVAPPPEEEEEEEQQKEQQQQQLHQLQLQL